MTRENTKDYDSAFVERRRLLMSAEYLCKMQGEQITERFTVYTNQEWIGKVHTADKKVI
jgi:hypothetical protein